MDNTTLYYFGTDLQEAGHYIWELHGERMHKNYNIKVPFNTYFPLHYSNSLGAAHFGEFVCNEHYSIWGCPGSCTDTRGGTVSVFWVKQQMSASDLKELILNTPIAKRIIKQMPFKVKW